MWLPLNILTLVCSNEKGVVYYVIGHLEPCVMLWPVQSFPFGPDILFRFAPPAPGLPIYETVVDLNKWHVHFTKWLIPVDVLLANKNRSVDRFPEAFAIQTKPGTIPILEYLTEHGFFDIKQAAINRFCKKEFDPPISLEGTFSELLVRLFMRIKGCSEAEALLYLECRLAWADALCS